MADLHATHIIRKQLIDLDIDDQKQAIHIQNTVSGLMNGRVLALLERIFNEQVSPQQWVRIDRLEIDLGVIELEKLSDQWLQKLEENFPKLISEKINQASDDPNADIIRMDTDQTLIEAYFYFLRSGQLPWWSPEKELSQLERLVLQAFANKPHLKNRLIRDMLNKEGVVLKRFLFQSSESFLKALDSSGWIAELEPIFPFLAEQLGTQKRKLRYVWLRALFSSPLPMVSSKRMDLKEQKRWVRKGLERLSNEVDHSGALLKQQLYFWLEKKTSTSGPQALPHRQQLLLEILEEEIKSGTIRPEEHIEPINKSQEKNKHLTNEPRKATTPKESTEPTEKVSSSESENPSEKNTSNINSFDDQHQMTERLTEVEGRAVSDIPASESLLYQEQSGWFVSFSGLVLLYPFLKELFHSLGWLEENQFVRQEVQERAVSFLGWLACASDDIPETELLLAKILCGLPIDHPIERGIELSDAEKNAGIELLEAIITHWKALKNTSPNGLRSAFLKREGKMTKTDQGYLLKVQPLGQDILLSKIPWGYSLVRLPWMERMLHVDWL